MIRRSAGDPVRFFKVTVPTDRRCDFKSISRASLVAGNADTNLPHPYPLDT